MKRYNCIKPCYFLDKDILQAIGIEQGLLQLHQTLFNPDRLQDIFVQKITELVNGRY